MYPELLDKIADAVNPLLALAALVFAFARNRSSREALSPWRFLGGVALSLAAVYLLHNLDARLRLWARLGVDYSTHTAFHACVATSLVLADRRWAVPLVPLFIGYASLMVRLGYHSPPDILLATALLAPLTVGGHALLRRVHSRSAGDAT